MMAYRRIKPLRFSSRLRTLAAGIMSVKYAQALTLHADTGGKPRKR
jgi:hypothetical protein